MPSGKRSKQQRREAKAPPPVQSKGAPRRRQASPRVLLGAAAVVVVAAVGIALGIVFTGGGSSSTPQNVPTYGSLANGLPGAADVNALLKGIPQKGNVLGSPSAPVTLIEYVDLQCPYCQEFETQVMPSLIKTYVRPGKVRVEARPLAFIGPDSVRGRKAMIAAGEQGKAFNFAELLYYNQRTENTGWLSDAMVTQAAESIPGLNVPKLLEARNSSAVASQATMFDALGNEQKVDQTPTIFVGRTGQKATQVNMAGATDKQAVVAALDAALAK